MQSKCWRYTVTDGNNGATMVMTEDGIVVVTSSFGNYAYRWSDMGTDVRTFVAGIDESYAYGKFAGRRRDVFDVDRTVKEIKRQILRKRREGILEADEARKEWDHVDVIAGDEDFYGWAMTTRIEDAWEFRCTKPEPQCWVFCTRLLPLLQAEIRAEMEREAA